MFCIRKGVCIAKPAVLCPPINFWNFARNFRSIYDPNEIHKNPIMKEEPSPSAPTKPDPNDFNGYIPLEKLHVTYTRSSGPGGQNVNKIPTCAIVKFHVDSADWIPKAVREALKSKYNYRITKEGNFIIRSERTRYRHFNLTDCLDKIRFTVRCLEEKVEKETKTPSQTDLQILERKQLNSVRRRLQEKRFNAEKKRVDDY